MKRGRAESAERKKVLLHRLAQWRSTYLWRLTRSPCESRYLWRAGPAGSVLHVPSCLYWHLTDGRENQARRRTSWSAPTASKINNPCTICW
jgi:hypothetical protein